MNNLNVLLLDDEPSIHEILKDYLYGVYDIYSAYSYDEAVGLLKEKGINFFKIFVCDLYLGNGRSGFDFIQNYLEGCKTIVISGLLEREVINDLIKKGVFTAHSKPIKLGNVFISMNSIIRCEK